MIKVYRYDFDQRSGDYETTTSILTDFDMTEKQKHAMTKWERGIDLEEELDEDMGAYWYGNTEGIIHLPIKGASMELDSAMLDQLQKLSGLPLVTLKEYNEDIKQYYES